MCYKLEFLDTNEEENIFSFPADVRDHVPKNGDKVEINGKTYTARNRKYKYKVDGEFGKLETVSVYMESKESI